MVMDLKVEDKNKDALSIADSGFGTLTAATDLEVHVEGLHSCAFVHERKYNHHHSH